jgi:hypothetical protein
METWFGTRKVGSDLSSWGAFLIIFQMFSKFKFDFVEVQEVRLDKDGTK